MGIEIYKFITRYIDKLWNFSSDDSLRQQYNQSSTKVQGIVSCSTAPEKAHGLLAH